MADSDAVDEIVANAQSWGVNPEPFLALLWWESGGLTRSIVWTNPDGSTGRAFPGGDYDHREDGTYGPCSFGAVQIYAKVHGPWRADGTPDYPAASGKWDSITTAMQYMSVNGPRGGWLKVYRDWGGDAAYAADPKGFMVNFAPRAQGSIAWERWMADQAVPAAQQMYADFLARHSAPPIELPPVEKPPFPPDIEARIAALESRTYDVEQRAYRLEQMKDALKGALLGTTHVLEQF